VSVLIVAPTAREAAACGRGALACGAGAGPGVRERVDALLQRQRPDMLIAAGVCGGLDPSLAPGSLVLGRRVVAPNQPEHLPDLAVLAPARRALRAGGVPYVLSTLLSVSRPAATRRQKTMLWNRYGAAGVDLETYAIVAAAEAHGVPWLALRAVLDPAAEGLPAAVRGWQGEADDRRILRQLALRPYTWPAYARLALQLRSALAALRRGVPLLAGAAGVALPLSDLEAERRIASR
jgi:adenosylhomocysteine nucleosidase